MPFGNEHFLAINQFLFDCRGYWLGSEHFKQFKGKYYRVHTEEHTHGFISNSGTVQDARIVYFETNQTLPKTNIA